MTEVVEETPASSQDGLQVDKSIVHVLRTTLELSIVVLISMAKSISYLNLEIIHDRTEF